MRPGCYHQATELTGRCAMETDFHLRETWVLIIRRLRILLSPLKRYAQATDWDVKMIIICYWHSATKSVSLSSSLNLSRRLCLLQRCCKWNLQPSILCGLLLSNNFAFRPLLFGNKMKGFNTSDRIHNGTSAGKTNAFIMFSVNLILSVNLQNFVSDMFAMAFAVFLRRTQFFYVVQ